jgi:uncharacterized protein
MERLPPARSRHSLVTIVIAAAALLIAARAAASIALEYQWWNELGQVSTWIKMALYRFVPVTAAAALAFVVLWITHARALKFAGTGLGERRRYAWISSLALVGFSALFALATVDTWTVVRYFGSRGMAIKNEYHDPVFSLPLTFYFFDLPFYELLLRVVLSLAVIAVLLYWLVARLWQLRTQFASMRESGAVGLDIRELHLSGALKAGFFRTIVALCLVGLAAKFALDLFATLYNEHRFLVGVDYVDEKVLLPTLWISIALSLAAAACIMVRRWRISIILIGAALAIQLVAPPAVGVFVRASEISLEKPYIQRHIQATRSAYGIAERVKEIDFPAQIEAPVDVARHKVALENIRLWDWRAYHDTITQIQALRPYYVFRDSDVDRYTINGEERQVLVNPREIDVRELRDAASRWNNPHFVYTHGYGLVMADANRITPDGSPVLLIQDAPPVIKSPDIKVTRPEIYYGEVSHEPVFVHTAQQEFDYPAGGQNIHNTYQGRGGFPISSLFLRLAATLEYGDWNILITSFLTDRSRMMIHRRVLDRLDTLAGFITWDADPYLVLTDEGRLVWIVDGYTTSSRHPYARSLDRDPFGPINYVRNAVKATVDAYDGSVHMYIFEPDDPIIRAYASLFPTLFQPAAEMPPGVRRHARYPEQIFMAQADIYRTYHMRDPESFYNNEDLWSFAKSAKGQNAETEFVASSYLMATLPGGTKPEFLLTIPFTPRSKDNMIGLMMARCDGEHLGEIAVLQLSKQALIYGPLQIGALIDQDQVISKDLTQWNQQGSQVVRGQVVILPIENTFLYMQPLYIQSQSARLPQLKKVVVAMGKRLIYRDSYQEALAELSGGTYQAPAAPVAAAPATPAGAPAAEPPPLPATDSRIGEIRRHLQRYRDLSAQGHWAEAGKELEAVEALAKK